MEKDLELILNDILEQLARIAANAEDFREEVIVKLDDLLLEEKGDGFSVLD